MKLQLTNVSQVIVDGSPTPCYRFENKAENAIIEFHAGTRAWTYTLGLATNAAGHRIAFDVVAAFMRRAADLVAQDIQPSETTLQTLEIRNVR